MKIALGCDHRGVEAVKMLAKHLKSAGHDTQVFGDLSGQSSDYPDAAWKVSRRVRDGEVDRGILVCSNGLGMCMAANKVPSVRGALVYDEINAERARAHNDANVLCVSGEMNSSEELVKLVDIFLKTPFEGGRHARRVSKIMAIEHGEDPTQLEADAARAR